MSLPIVLTMMSDTTFGVIADKIPSGKLKIVVMCNVLACAFFLMLAAPFSRNVNHGFLYICVVFAFYRFLRSPTMPVLDAYTLEYLVLRGTAASKMKYGKYRLWGAVSWGVISVAIGLCLDHYGFSSMYAFSAITTTFLLVLCARERWHGGKAMETHFVPFSREEEVMSAAEATQSASIGYSEEEEETEFTDGDSGSLLGSFEGLGADCERQESVLGFCRVLLTNPRSIAFLFTVASSRVGTSLVENLVFLFFAQELRASYFLCGVAVAITVSRRMKSLVPHIFLRHMRFC